MSSNVVFRIALAILFAVVIGVRRVFERRAQQMSVSQIKQDRDSSGLIIAQSALLTLSNLGIIAYIINPRWMAWSSIPLPLWLSWLGVGLGVAGTALLVWSHRALGENFFGGMKIRQFHQLVTTGPYRWVRHPIYTSFLLLGIAWFFLTGNWLIFGLWIAAAVLVLVSRLGQEEAMMLEEFGEEYEAYVKRTGRFLPGL